MHDFLVNSALIFATIFYLFDISCCIFLIFKYLKTKEIYVLLMALIAFGLFYDAFFVCMSGYLPISAVQTGFFKFLSRLRYVLHGALIPLMFTICALILRLNKKWLIASIVLTSIVSIIGIIIGFIEPLEIETIGNINRYASTATGAMKRISLMSTIIPMLLLVIVGIYLLIKQKNCFILLAGLLMYIFAAIGGAISALKDLNFLISMVGEIFMIFFFVLYVLSKEKLSKEKLSKEREKINQN